MTIRDENYFTDKYGLTRTHSEVVYAATQVPPGKALDLGCGNGRNSLYLAANGFDVTAWDKNPMSINNLESIRAQEELTNLQAAVKDLKLLEAAGQPLLSFRQLNVAVGESDLLGARFAIDKVVLDAPDISAGVNREGALNWLAMLPISSTVSR